MSGWCRKSRLLVGVRKDRLGHPTPCSVGVITVASGIWGAARGVEGGGGLPLIVGSALALPPVRLGALGKLFDLFGTWFLRCKLGDYEVDTSALQGGPRSLVAFGGEPSRPQVLRAGPLQQHSRCHG